VRTSTRIGIVGSSVAVAGSAALAAFAPSAGAAAGQASSARYDSTATATVGSVDIDGNTQSLLAATATSGDSPHSASIGSGQVLSAVQGVPTLGPALATAFEKANPGGTDLVTESATASPDGTSTACAAILAADCTTKPMSLVLNLGLGDLPAVSSPSSSSTSSSAGGSGNPVSSVLGQVGQAVGKVTGHSSQASSTSQATQAGKGSSPLDYTLRLTINGPRASCSAGPAGSGDLSATDNPAGATVDLVANGKSVLPGGPIAVSGGSIVQQLLDSVGGTPVSSLLSGLESKAPLALTLDPNSRKYISGSKATATAGEVGLSSGGTTIFDVKAATVTCGPNTQAATTSTSSSTMPPAGTSAEKPLTGIQTDEGRWVPPARSDALWIGLAAGGAVLAGGTGGLTLWRRRLHR
jgi:hypothetical protein